MYEIRDNGAETIHQLEFHSESSVSIKVAPAKLQAVLRGTPQREVGDGTASNHYSLIVDASPSSHPTIPVSYLWSCIDDVGIARSYSFVDRQHGRQKEHFFFVNIKPHRTNMLFGSLPFYEIIVKRLNIFETEATAVLRLRSSGNFRVAC